MSQFNEELFGKVCECSTGRLGVVTGIRTLPWGESYVGVALGQDGGHVLWSSRTPEVVYQSISDYHDAEEERMRKQEAEGGA